MSLADATRLGPYEILDLIGSRGVGEVDRARDACLDRVVTIKGWLSMWPTAARCANAWSTKRALSPA